MDDYTLGVLTNMGLFSFVALSAYVLLVAGEMSFGQQAFDVDVPVQRPVGCNHERLGLGDRIERILVADDRQIVRKPGGGRIVHVDSRSLPDEPAAQFNR